MSIRGLTRALVLLAPSFLASAADKQPPPAGQQPGTASMAPTPTRPSMAALMSSAAETSAPERLRALNDALAVRIKGKLDADAAKATGQFQQVQGMTVRACPKPQIDSVFPFSNFTPEGTVLIFGCGFGAHFQGPEPSKLVLTLSSGYYVPLGSLHWSNNAIVGTLPSLVNGVLSVAKTQPATLTVTTQHGSATSPPVTYRAPRIVMKYPFRQLTHNISHEASTNTCTVSSDAPQAWCFHELIRWRWDVLLMGKDVYTIDLKNGWLLDSWDFIGGAGCCIQGPGPRKDGQGQAHFTATFGWFLPCHNGCYMYYRIQPYVEGELGTTPF